MIYTINGASYDSNYLAHHGIKGMKWGVRRYQNPDGSLTAAGRKRYQNPDGTLNKKGDRHIRKAMLISGPGASFKNREEVRRKIRSEINSTKEAKAYDEFNKRVPLITTTDSYGRIVNQSRSYLEADWSDPGKVMEQMAKDYEIEKAYREKGREIMNKYAKDIAGALLKDLGYEDTEAGRNYLLESGILVKYK